MKELTILILLLVFTFHVFPQENSEDPVMATADSMFNEGLYDAAIAKYREIIDSKGKLRPGEFKPVAGCYLNIGVSYYQLSNFDEAILAFKAAADLQERAGDREAMASTLHNIGLCYKKQGNFETAIEYYNQTVKIDEESGKPEDIASTLNNIGMIYRSWGKYDMAIDYFEKSLAIKKGLNDTDGIATTLNNIGLVYADWKKYKEAMQLFRESLAMEETLQNKSEIALRYNNIGLVCFHMQQFDTSLVWFNKSLKINKELNEPAQIALAYNNIGKVYQAKGQLKDAEEGFRSALAMFRELGMESETSTVMANLGTICLLMGRPDQAAALIDSSIAIAERLDLKSQLQRNYLSLSNIFSDKREFERSLEYYKKYTAVKDSVFNKETLSKLTEFQAKYEKEKDQARILALEKENLQKTNQRNGYFFTAIGLILIALFIIVYFRQRAIQMKIITDQKIRQLEEEKKMMAARLLAEGQEEERKRIATELHDGLGVLLSATKMQFSVIHDKNPENKALIDKATKMLEQASNDVRKISHNMMPGLLTKLGFFEAVEDLFEQIGNNPDLEVSLNISGEQDRMSENKEIMLYRIVQELVNNTLKHANARNISLSISNKEGLMEINYSDDGKGFDSNQPLLSQSIGLQSIQSRVNFLNGTLDLETMPGKGVRYVIRVPV